MFNIGDVVFVSNKMQQNYQYEITAPSGNEFASNFKPALTPKEMLKMGVFEGHYLNSCWDEYPTDWLQDAKLSEKPDASKNYFNVKSRQPLSIWRQKGWILDPDPRGWFEWYCRYYLGRRIQGIDAYQIKRWRAFKRHAAQVKNNCNAGDIWCRPRQRQALLQWAYDPFI